MESFIAKIYPHLSDEVISKIAKDFCLGDVSKWFAIAGGWSNVNLKLVAKKGEYVVRFYRYGARSYDDINLEIMVLDRLKTFGLPVVPPISNCNGERIAQLELAGKNVYYAVFEYIAGEQPILLNLGQLISLGGILGRIHLALSQFKSPYIKKYWRFKTEISKIARKINKRTVYHHWNFEDILPKEKFLDFVKNEVNYFLDEEKRFRKILKAKSIIHGDFHAANVKFRGNKVVGVFDFDSLIYAPIVLDLAICIANLAMQNIEAGGDLSLSQIENKVKVGYFKVMQLTSQEKLVLPVLVRFWLFSQFGWCLKMAESEGQAHFYRQVFSRVIKILM